MASLQPTQVLQKARSHCSQFVSHTEHLKANHKDHSSERALKMLVGKRRRLLDYLIKVDIERYRAIIKELGIRK